jgi:hypothetical protein
MAPPVESSNNRKRSLDTLIPVEQQQQQQQPVSSSSASPSSSPSYRGYVLEHDNNQNELDRVDPNQTTPSDFFRDYIAKRKPCILTNLMMVKPLTVQQLKDCTTDLRVVQVERRLDIHKPFGQNRSKDTQELLTMKELFELWEQPENRELYYLSSQQLEEGEDEQQQQQQPLLDDNNHNPFFGPCQALYQNGFLHESLPLAGQLVLQQCNLWMGMADGSSSSSGLHHDFHDNFYLLVSGKKEFRLYAPSEYPVMETYGTVDCLHANGLISYQNEPTRSDGVPLTMIMNDGEQSVDESESDDDGEEEVVLGKGFDYKSSDEDEDFDEENEVDDYSDQAENDNQVKTEKGSDLKAVSSNTAVPRPDNFSMIDPSLPRRELEREYPNFCKSKECLVTLKSGEALYLPASWFHCVTSSPGTDELHMAVNYWYHPPNKLDTFEEPYMDSFWGKRQDDRTKTVSDSQTSTT